MLKKMFSFRINIELIEAIKKRAEKDHSTVTDVIHKALRKYLGVK